jgi:hypothetical protein
VNRDDECMILKSAFGTLWSSGIIYDSYNQKPITGGLLRASPSNYIFSLALIYSSITVRDPSNLTTWSVVKSTSLL